MFSSLNHALQWGRDKLLSASNLNPTEALRKARVLLSYTLNQDPSYLYGFPETHLSLPEESLFKNLILKAVEGTPLSRILKEREFWSLPFFINVATLDPRPDSELIIEVTLKLLKNRDSPFRILDLGTGSGCLLLSLLHMLPNADGIGLDLSFEAAFCAQKNSVNLELHERSRFFQGSWTEAIGGMFDIIVSNPPYIRECDITLLDPTVRLFDPVLALDGGQDGLDSYRQIIPNLKKLLSPEGFVLVEIGSTQESEVKNMFQSQDFQDILCHLDLEGRPRVISARLN